MSEEEKKDEVVSTEEDKVDNIKKTTNKSDKEVVTSAEADSKADKVEKKKRLQKIYLVQTLSKLRYERLKVVRI